MVLTVAIFRQNRWWLLRVLMGRWLQRTNEVRVFCFERCPRCHVEVNFV